MLGAEGGEKVSIRLLPAYVKRRKLEEKVVLEVLELDTIAAAFEYLKERLDPVKDTFVSAERFLEMNWPPGELAVDFFVRYLDEASCAGLTPKQACVFLVTKMPQETQAKLKEWVRARDAELAEDGVMKMAGEVIATLILKDIPLYMGFRGTASKIACIESSLKEKESDCDSGEESKEINAVSKNKEWLPNQRTEVARGQE